MDPTPHSVAASRVEMTEIILPQFANAIGTAFGGQILAWMDTAAAVAAQRHCQGSAVTAAIDRVDFQKPIRQGDIVTLLAHLTYTGRSSMEIEVSVFAEHNDRPRTLCVHAYLTFVQIGPDGPCPVPALVCVTDEERARFEGGKARAQHRRES